MQESLTRFHWFVRIAALPWLGLSVTQAQTVISQSAPQGEISSVSFFGEQSVLRDVRATAFFLDGSTSSTLFAVSTGQTGDSAIAITPLFRIFVTTVSPNNNNFEITAMQSGTNLLGFRLDGYGDGAGAAAFDRDSASIGGGNTNGSNAGGDAFVDFSLLPRSLRTGATYTATYIGALGLNGALPAGDLFGSIDIRWQLADLAQLGNGGGLPGGTTFSTLNFSLDIDQVTFVSVPEPATLMLSALGGFALLRRRR